MRYRGYELILHLFCIRKLLRHVVDRVAKLAKLVISFLFKTFAEISRSIPPCYAVYASYRQNNRFVKNIPEKNMSIMTATTIAVIIIDIIKI